jgi:hypothetical protein
LNDIRVLVISHNAFSTSNNMGKTLAALFHEFDKKEIAQLYFHPINPDIYLSSSWYQITDFDVLQSILHRKQCGRVVHINKVKVFNENTPISKIYKHGKTHSPLKLLIRDMCWKLGSWKTKDLHSWVEEFSPTHVFFASGYSMFAFNVALYISQTYNIPLIPYFCDDYYNENIKTFSPIYWVRRFIFRHKVADTISKSSDLIFISESMQREYQEIFHKRGHVIMTPYSMKLNERIHSNSPIVISYIGNALLGRGEVLVKIGEAINRINRNNTKIIFQVYSGNIDDRIINALNTDDRTYFKGKLSEQGVRDKVIESDVLLHVESFEEGFISKTRHSISTKIADSLASGRVILAVGPRGIASIDYLRENNAAYIIDSESIIEDKLGRYFIENDIDDQIIRNAEELSKLNHDIIKNSQRLKKIFDNTAKGR